MFEQKKTITLDTLIHNIRSKVDSGCNISGEVVSDSGLLVEGTIIGDVVVSGGPLLIMPGAKLLGNILCHGDLVACGQLGNPDANPRQKITVMGLTQLANTSIVAADLYHHGLEVYEGACITSEVKDLRPKTTATA